MANLSEPLLAKLVSLRFFNGRLLTGDDLTREQRNAYARDERIAAALGSGIVAGLEVDVFDAAGLTLALTPGRAINLRGVWLELTKDTSLKLELPTTPPAEPRRAEWRPCAMPLPPELKPARPPAAGIYLLTIGPATLDSTETARVLQIDRSNDPCTVSYVREAVVLRAIRMTVLTEALAGVPDAQLRNAAAHACFATAELPADPSHPVPGGAIEALRGKQAELAEDVPLAILRIGGDLKIAWVDMWSARRRPVPPAHYVLFERVTGPHSLAEAEARLLQFQDQIARLPAPPDRSERDGAASETFAWLPPAGLLPPGWDAEAWARFFGNFMAPPAVRPCDPALLPSILAGAARSAAIPVPPGADATDAPAIDVYVARDPTTHTDGAVVFVQSTQSRALVELENANNSVKSGMLKQLSVRLVSADGLRSWDMIRRGKHTWVSPDVEPGDYTIQLVSPVLAAETVPALSTVAGRVHATSLAVKPVAGKIVVDAPETEYLDVYEVFATRDNRRLDAVWDPLARRWLVEGALAGTWTVTGRARGRLSALLTRTADVVVNAGHTTAVTLEFAEKVEAPPHWLTYDHDAQRKIKLVMIEMSVTDRIHDLVRELKGGDYYMQRRAEYEAVTTGMMAASAYKDFLPKSQVPEATEALKLGDRSIYMRKPTAGASDGTNYAELRQWGASVAFKAFVPLAQLPDTVGAWLAKWQLWIAFNEPSEAERAAILAATPALWLKPGTTLLSLADNRSPPTTTEVWAVFGPTALPVGVTREASRMPTKYVPIDYTLLLKKRKKFPWDLPTYYGIDEIAAMGKDIKDQLIQWPAGGPDDHYGALLERAIVANNAYEYALPESLRVQIGPIGKSGVVLANTSFDVLMDKLGGDSLLVHEVQGRIREAVPADKWSVRARYPQQADRLESAGVFSFGDFATLETSVLEKLKFSTEELDTLGLQRVKVFQDAVNADITKEFDSHAAAEEMGAAELKIDLLSRAGAKRSSEKLSPGAQKAALLAANKRADVVKAMAEGFGAEVSENFVAADFVVRKG